MSCIHGFLNGRYEKKILYQWAEFNISSPIKKIMIISKKIIFKLQADSNMNDLIAEYQQYEDAGIDDVIYDEDEYEELVEFSGDASNNI